MTAASTALNTYDIVVLILPYLCDDGFPKDLLFLQRVNTTWRAVVGNSSKLQQSLFLTEPPTKPFSRMAFQSATKLHVLLKSLICVYDTKLQEFNWLVPFFELGAEFILRWEGLLPRYASCGVRCSRVGSGKRPLWSLQYYQDVDPMDRSFLRGVVLLGAHPVLACIRF